MRPSLSDTHTHQPASQFSIAYVPSSPEPTKRNRHFGWPGIIGSSAALTWAAYAVVRAEVDYFYAPLHITPEQVGIGYPALLIDAAGTFFVGLIQAVAIAAVLLGVMFVFTRRMTPIGRAWIVTGVSVSTFIAVEIAVAKHPPSYVTVQTLTLQMLIFFTASCLLAWFWSRLGPLGGAIVLSLLLAALLTAINLRAEARTALSEVRNGWAIGGQSFGLPSVPMPFSATVASLAWLRTPPLAFRNNMSCVLAIHQTSDGTEIYMTDRRGERTVADISATAAVIVLRPDEQRCPRWPRRPAMPPPPSLAPWG